MQNIKEKVFIEDGSWRETNLYNLKSPEDQIKFIKLFNLHMIKSELFINNEKVEFNTKLISEYFSEPVGLRFSFYVHLHLTNVIYFTAHFFNNESIEIEIYPDLLKTEDDIQITLELFNILSQSFEQDMHITPENNGDYYLLKHNWKTGEFILWDDWYNKY